MTTPIPTPAVSGTRTALPRFVLACGRCLPALAFLGATATAAGAQAVPVRGITESRGAGAELVLTEVRRIGSLDGPDALARVMDAKFSASGNVYVADDLNHRVAVFSPEGRLLGTMGRRGSGPGELTRPWRIAVDARDTLFVWDAGLARISVFGPQRTFVRSFNVPREWMINSLDFLPDGRLVVAAFSSTERGAIHYLRRDGSGKVSFGPVFDASRIPVGFRSSLLGGHADVADGVLTYTAKSPYDLMFFDFAGRLRGRCRGDRGWTTRPEEVVEGDARNQNLRWQKFVHSAQVLALGGGTYLNVLLDPGAERTTADLLTADCRLLRRQTLDATTLFTDRRGDLLLAHRNAEYPEVVVYRYQVRPART